MDLINRSLFAPYRWQSSRWLFGGLSLLLALAGGWLVGTFGVMGAVMAVGLLVCIFILAGVLMEPKLGLLLYIHISFLLGFSRFIQSEFPLGLSLDGLLVLTLLSVFLNGKQMNWKRLKHPVFFVLTIWLIYTITELLNPEAPYRPAWFFHARAFSLNWYYIAIIVFVMPITKSDIRLLINTWLFWSFMAALWAFKQQYIGLAEAEARWLAEGAAKTHVLWGQLRSFSFYSDASQFGAEMAGVTLACLIYLFDEKNLFRRVLYILMIFICFWGFAVSGTRSALFVLLAGYPAYLVVRRKAKHILWSAAVAIPILFLLLFTHLGDSNYQIYRIRTALHPSEDLSFLVRLENQQKLRAYLKDLPFGAGIGTSSDAGTRFSPDHFAAQIPPDSWYVELWIETGIVGLSLYLFMLVLIIGIGIYKIWQLKDPWTSRIMIAFLAEFIGIAVMSYSNPSIGQIPSSTILFISSILFTTCDRWNTESVPATPLIRKNVTPIIA